MIIHSDCFGEITVPDNYIFQFPQGISGFEQEKEFAIIKNQSDGVFLFLQSTKSSDVVFAAIDPFDYFNNYQVEIDESTEKLLQINKGEFPTVVCLVNIPSDKQKITANLLAPLIINWSKNLATQVVLSQSNYATRHLVFSDTAETVQQAGEC